MIACRHPPLCWSAILFANKYRNLGNSLAFQEHLQFFRNPIYYLIPRDISPMDVFLNLNLN